jgi:hypothetical protein
MAIVDRQRHTSGRHDSSAKEREWRSFAARKFVFPAESRRHFRKDYADARAGVKQVKGTLNQSRPYKWWSRHDSYVPRAAPDPKWVEVTDAGEAAFRKRDGGLRARDEA